MKGGDVEFSDDELTAAACRLLDAGMLLTVATLRRSGARGDCNRMCVAIRLARLARRRPAADDDELEPAEPETPAPVLRRLRAATRWKAALIRRDRSTEPLLSRIERPGKFDLACPILCPDEPFEM